MNDGHYARMLFRRYMMPFAFALVIIGCGNSSREDAQAIETLFSLSSRLQQVEAHHFADGGTFGLVLTDEANRTANLCLSSARFTQVIPKEKAGLPETNEQLSELKRVQIYVGALHPNNINAIEVQYNSMLEMDITKHLRMLGEKNPQFADPVEEFIARSQGEREITVIYE